MSNLEILWCVPAHSDLLWEEWETEYTIFDRRSGETHLISELPAQLLRLLSRQSANTSHLAAELAHLCETDNSKRWIEQTSGIINNLTSIGLVEAQTP